MAFLNSLQTHADRTCAFFLYWIFFALPTSKSLLYLGIVGFISCSMAAGKWREKFEIILGDNVSRILAAVYVLVLMGCLYGLGERFQQLNHLQYYGKLLFGIWILCEIRSNPKRQGIALLTFSIAMAISAVVSILKWQGILSDTLAKALGAVAGDHAAFKDYLIQNVMMGMFIIISIAKYTTHARGNWQYRAFWGSALILGFTALFIAVERGRTGQIGLILGLMLICITTVQPSRWLPFLLAAVSLLVATYYFHEAWREHINRAVSEAVNYQSNPLSSVGNRIFLYDWSINHILSRDWLNQLIGDGTASYPHLAKSNFNVATCVTSCPHPHSQFLFFWIENGLIGLIAFSCLPAYLLKLAIKTPSSESRILLVGFIGIFLADSVFHSSLWLRIEGYFSVMMIALLASMAHAHDQSSFQTPRSKELSH
jgi:O-antigen ligase